MKPEDRAELVRLKELKKAKEANEEVKPEVKPKRGRKAK